jgi:ribose transport system permease protein
MNKEGTKGIALANVLQSAKKSSMLSSVVIVIVLLTIMLILKPNYLSSENVYALSKVLTVTALIGFSQMICIAAGGLNVSVGATGALCAVLAGGAMEIMNVPTGWAFLIGIAAGAICGLINGLLIYRAGGVGVAYFLTTLATMSLFQGINYTITSGSPFYKIKSGFIAIGDTKIFGLPSSFFIMVIVAAILVFMFKKMIIGRQILAFGANSKSSELYGVSKFKVVLIANIIASVLAAIAGLMALIRIEAAQPSMGGDWMLLSFAATLIGGTRLEGGKVNVVGVIVGASALTIISNALVYMKVNVYWNSLIYGLVILLACTIDRIRYIKK